ncbi:unnamed protein product [Cyprideis torosa]|uniref:Uncharacterized protein n=1 Tax=Cyprideis torosa TaxID=163714 RepID=A0A7R8ZV03_9CRUS|nr:unnamed protein product [Cyprideis torosa]CAG0901905.1 unnamed protein product [Cyprideis torosa]
MSKHSRSHKSAAMLRRTKVEYMSGGGNICLGSNPAPRPTAPSQPQPTPRMMSNMHHNPAYVMYYNPSPMIPMSPYSYTGPIGPSLPIMEINHGVPMVDPRQGDNTMGISPALGEAHPEVPNVDSTYKPAETTKPTDTAAVETRSERFEKLELKLELERNREEKEIAQMEVTDLRQTRDLAFEEIDHLEKELKKQKELVDKMKGESRKQAERNAKMRRMLESRGVKLEDSLPSPKRSSKRSASKKRTGRSYRGGMSKSEERRRAQGQKTAQKGRTGTTAKERDELKKQVAALERDLQKALADEQNAHTELKKLRQNNEDLRSKNVMLEVEVDALENKRRFLEGEITRFQKERDQEHFMYKKVDQERENAERETAKVKVDRDKLRERNQRLTQMMDKLEEDHRELGLKYAALTRQTMNSTNFQETQGPVVARTHMPPTRVLPVSRQWIKGRIKEWGWRSFKKKWKEAEGMRQSKLPLEEEGRRDRPISWISTVGPWSK